MPCSLASSVYKIEIRPLISEFYFALLETEEERRVKVLLSEKDFN
jgi:hypothetical protein